MSTHPLAVSRQPLAEAASSSTSTARSRTSRPRLRGRYRARACPICCANSKGASAALRSCPVARSPIWRRTSPSRSTSWGSYGLEWRSEGRHHTLREAEEWRPLIQELTDEAVACFGEAVVEPKGLSLTVHYRTDPELRAPMQAWSRTWRSEPVPRGAPPSTPSRCTRRFVGTRARPSWNGRRT